MHIPVLKSEVLKYIDPEPGRQFIDCTINGGGHAQAILERTGSKGSLLGIDLTPEFIEQLKKKKDKKSGYIKIMVFRQLRKVFTLIASLLCF